MSNLQFHNKFHRTNHHTVSSQAFPDSATDPIASQDQPFIGIFYNTFTDNFANFVNSNSIEWKTLYTSTNTYSADWSLYPSVSTIVKDNSANWDNSFSFFNILSSVSSNEETTYTTLSANSGLYYLTNLYGLFTNRSQINTQSKIFKGIDVFPTLSANRFTYFIDTLSSFSLSAGQISVAGSNNDGQLGIQESISLSFIGIENADLRIKGNENWYITKLPEISSTGLTKFVFIKDIFLSTVVFTTSTIRTTDGINFTVLNNLPEILKDASSSNIATNGEILTILSKDKCIYSNDYGITWNSVQLTTVSADWLGITYGNNIFVAVPRTANQAAYSSDGINWISSTMPASGLWVLPAYGDGTFVTTKIDSASRAVATTTDGITWVYDPLALPFTDIWGAIEYSPIYNTFYTIGSNGISRSSDYGLTWSGTTSIGWPGAYTNGIAYGNFVIRAVPYGSFNTEIFSLGLNTWSSKIIFDLTPRPEWNYLTYGNGIFLTTTSDGASAAVMSDFYSINDTKNFTDISCGRNFSYSISGTKLFSTGSNSYGQLSQTLNVSKLSSFTSTLTGDFYKVSCGQFHTIALSTNNIVFGVGFNEYGQLGIERGSYRAVTNTFNEYEFTTGNNLTARFLDIAAGGYHSLALSANGILFATGLNSDGQLGILNNNNQYSYVTCLTGQFQKIAAGENFSIAISSGSIFSTGNNNYGQLGLGDNNSRNEFCIALSGNFDQISCGAFHVAALSSGILYTVGRNDNGQLGLGDTSDRTVFTEVTGYKFDLISCGPFHTLALSGNRIFSTGLNNNGQLGLYNTLSSYNFTQTISGLFFKIAGGGETGPTPEGFSLALPLSTNILETTFTVITSFSASFYWTLSSEQNAFCILSADYTVIENPVGPLRGGEYYLTLKQNVTGSRAVLFKDKYIFPNYTTPGNLMNLSAFGATIFKFVSDGEYLYGKPNKYVFAFPLMYIAGPGISLGSNPSDSTPGDQFVSDGSLTIFELVPYYSGFGLTILYEGV